jgi:hypothetical protein
VEYSLQPKGTVEGLAFPGGEDSPSAVLSAPPRLRVWQAKWLPLPGRKRPGRTVYAQMHNEKEQEMTSPVSHSEDAQSTIQGRDCGTTTPHLLPPGGPLPPRFPDHRCPEGGHLANKA